VEREFLGFKFSREDLNSLNVWSQMVSPARLNIKSDIPVAISGREGLKLAN
jgi:hypothetical protein